MRLSVIAETLLFLQAKLSLGVHFLTINNIQFVSCPLKILSDSFKFMKGREVK